MTWQPPASWAEHVDLREWHTFHLPVKARYALEVHRPRQLLTAVAAAAEADLPVLILGGGSNVLFTDDYPGLVARIAMLGVHPEPKKDGDVLVTAMAGENWHELVAFCLEQGWYGLENLALIPGSVGAAPVQNIGAYGVEVGERIESVTYMDLQDGELKSLSADECRFAYRDSIFKQELRGRAVIISCTLRLSTKPAINISYPALRQALGGDGVTPRQVFDTVCAIRQSKLPDPAELGNAGSFFRNPIISNAQYQTLKQQWPDMPAFALAAKPDGKSGAKPDDIVGDNVKVPAAWLIEKAGWKGLRRGQIGVHDRQALVLVHDYHHVDAVEEGARHDNPGQALLALARDIARSVAEQFDVSLEPEVGIQLPGTWTA